MNVVGLGGAGCAFVDELESYEQYNVYKIDKGLPRKGNTYPISAQATHEDYESNPPKLTQFISRMPRARSLVFVMAGGGATSGASLKILEQFHKKYPKSIDIIYIKPDVNSLSEVARLQDKVCYRVLQEYVRSGVFRSMLLLSNPHTEAALGSLPVKDYYKNLNRYLAYAFHMTNVFKNTDSVISSSTAQREPHVRICTLGVVDVEKKEEKMFFPLDKPRVKEYYYGITKERVENDKTLLSSIREHIGSFSGGESSSYSIHETSYEVDFGYVISWTSNVQAFPDAYESL